jgi:hypothetical protein
VPEDGQPPKRSVPENGRPQRAGSLWPRPAARDDARKRSTAPLPCHRPPNLKGKFQAVRPTVAHGHFRSSDRPESGLLRKKRSALRSVLGWRLLSAHRPRRGGVEMLTNDRSEGTVAIGRRPLVGADPPKRSLKGRRRLSTPGACRTSAVRSAEPAVPTQSGYCKIRIRFCEAVIACNDCVGVGVGVDSQCLAANFFAFNRAIQPLPG